MLRQIPAPTTPDKAAWERFRAYLVSAAMEPADGESGLTPAQAAPIADAQARAVFAQRFAAQTFPIPTEQPAQSASDAPLPGGQRTNDGRTWVVVSRPEDGRSAFPESERITPALLRSMTQSYSPETIHRAPVVLPLDGPSHFTGEYADRTPGQIDALSFDGYFMWALIAENQAGVSEAVRNGLSNRSIRWWPEWPDAGGQPYLRHLAVTAEPAGTSNLGNLDNFFRTEQARRGKSDGDIRQLAELPTCERTVSDLPTIERSFTMADETITLNPNALIEALRTAGLKTQAPTAPAPVDVEALARSIATQMAAGQGEAIRTAVEAATKPLADELAEIKTRTATEAKANRTARLNDAMDAAVRTRRITPQERTTLSAVAEHLPAEAFEKLLQDVAARSVLPFASASAPLLVNPQDGSTTAVPNGLLSPTSTTFRVHPTQGRAVIGAFEKAQEAVRSGKSENEAAEAARAALKASLTN